MFVWFHHFQFLVIIVEAYYLQHFITSSISGDEGWLIKNPYNGVSVHTFICGGTIMFGGYQIFGCFSSTKTSIMKYFSLPPHYQVLIDIYFWKIDNWPSNQYFNISIDQYTHSWYFLDNTGGTNICGGSGTDYSTSFYNNYNQHTLNSIIVEFIADCDNTNFWGITDIRITLYECYLGCQFCLDSTNDCIQWILWKSYFDQQNLDNGLEGWIKNNRFGQFTYSTNDFQYKMIILNQWDSAIKYLTIPDHRTLIIQFRIENLSVVPLRVRVYINDEYKYGLVSQNTYVDYRTPQIEDNKNSIKLEIYSVDGQVCIRELQIILQGPINLHSCFDDNLIPFDGCFNNQESCVEGCQFCIKAECLMCDSKWNFNLENKDCQPQCGDQFITGNEQCDDGNDIPYDGCHKCYFSCPLQCINCLFGKCQTCTSDYQYLNGICIQNYYNLPIDSLNEVQLHINQLSNYQLPICGDAKVQQNEQCDDGNNFPNDGCYNCTFQCIINCLLCNFGVCQNCIPNYELINYQCLDKKTQFESVICDTSDDYLNKNFILQYTFKSSDFDNYQHDLCDIGIQKINYQIEIQQLSCSLFCETCYFGQCKKCKADHFLLKNECFSQITKGVLLFEDGIHESYIEIGCYKCGNSCQIQCLQCLDNSYCLFCIQGWSLMNGICIEKCGDNQVALYSQEECDSNQNDCLNCRLICPENCKFCIKSQECLICNEQYIMINNKCQQSCLTGCKKCIEGICYDNCLNGELNIDGICYSICGDGIQQQKEQCDDGNSIQFDGCYKCEYSCPLYCQNCFEGICYECQSYFQLIDNTCYDGCGSGIKAYNEECDDGNIIELDGCSSTCQIELQYKCQEISFSYSDCQYSPSPYMIITFLNQTYNKYYLEITFSQAIYFNENYLLQTLFNFSIDQLSITDYSIKLQSNYQPLINSILHFVFSIEIQFFNSTNSSLINLNIQLNNQAFNQEDIELLNPSQQIFLKQSLSMSQSDIQKTIQLTQSQEIMIITQGIAGVFVLISGNFQIFVEILDNLQYQSYFKYINIIYPENLYIFFESTTLISILPIFHYFNIDHLYSQFLFQDFIESYAKLKFYNLNAHLITNLEFFFIQVISTILFVVILKTVTYISFKIIYKIQTQHLLVLKLRSFKSKQLILVLNWIYNFFHQIQVFIYEFYQNGLIDLLLANAWDLLFKAFLQLESSQYQDVISLIQIALSYIILAASATFITYSIKRFYSKKEYKINYKYKAVYLLKQFLFCYFLICYQSNQVIQLLLLTTTNMIYLIALIFIEFNLQKLDKIQLVILEISILSFMFSSIFHLQDYRYLISEENKILLGFAQIYLLISSLLGIFIKQIIMIYQLIKKRCLKKRKRNSVFKKATHLIFEAVM
ncbi:unnamed protein product [Paramecium sonneborni]|uniref:Uncharacterized protein n=1 Tax=Paramecium sonneborni TaxID=65129 RepID=A0A8S1RJ10_9CILI|nr:unnamed protein product [Paramecium sonneborni]